MFSSNATPVSLYSKTLHFLSFIVSPSNVLSFQIYDKSQAIKNKYHNLGISSTAYVIENNDDEEDKLTNDTLNDIDENTKTVESFLYTFEGDTIKDNN